MDLNRRSGSQYKSFIGALCASFLFSCTSKESLPEIGTEISAPMSVAVDQGKNHFYVLNGDYNRRFHSGSITKVSRDGSTKEAVNVPHYGRSLKIAGDHMLVTYDQNPEEDNKTYVDLFQVFDGKLPELKKRWEFDECRALNSVIRTDPNANHAVYKYFAVACENGDLLLGTLASDLSQSTLTKARDTPGFVRRAMHIDPANGLLYAFVTDMNVPNSRDQIMKDVRSYNPDDGTFTDKASDTPDRYLEDKVRRQRLQKSGSEFQFMVLDLLSEDNHESGNVDSPFILRDYDSTKSQEFRWLYWTGADDVDELNHFKLSVKSIEENADAQGDELETLMKKYKYYRTNFWDAYENPQDTTGSSFFLSHRGFGDETNSPYANGVILVQLQSGKEKKDVLEMQNLTDSIFSFKKVYGLRGHRRVTHKGDDGNLSYASNYLGKVAFSGVESDSDVMIVNSFRGSDHFQDTEYSLRAAKKNPEATTANAWLDSNFAMAPNVSVEDASRNETSLPGFFHEFAVSDVATGGVFDAKVLVTSFFDDSVILLNLTNSGFEEVSRHK